MGFTVFDQTVGEDEVNTFQDLTFEEVLEDLSARFIVNLPPEEQELVRVYWQVEQAHWFYEDYVRPLNPHLPSYSQRAFAHLFISQSPYVSEYYDTVEMEKGYDEWMRYKSQVPVCGGILLNETADKCLLVRGYKSNAAWSFPRGKINLDESEADCAVREGFEETGYDFRPLLRPKEFVQCRVAQQVVTLFLVSGVPEQTVFETQTRMEIGAIEWVPLAELPTWKKKKGAKADSGKEKKYYMVAPFVGHIKTWVKQYKKANNSTLQASTSTLPPTSTQLTPALPSPVSLVDALVPPSALDVLFSRFMNNKLDEAPTPVLKVASPQDEDDATQDDALTRLLSGLTAAPPAAPKPAPPTAVQPINPLLALLNAKPPQPPAPAPAPSPHQSALLAMLSPSKQGSQLKPSSVGGLASHFADLSREQSQTPASALFADLARGPISPNAFQPPPPAKAKPSSMPTSPRQASHSPDENKAKQRALLEMMVSGLPPLPLGAGSSSLSASTPSTSGTSSVYAARDTATWVADHGLPPMATNGDMSGGRTQQPHQQQPMAAHAQFSGPSQPSWLPYSHQQQQQPPLGLPTATVLPHLREPGMHGYGIPPQQPSRNLPPHPPNTSYPQPLSQLYHPPPQGMHQQQHAQPPLQPYRQQLPPTHNRSGSRDLPKHHQQQLQSLNQRQPPQPPHQQQPYGYAPPPQQWTQQPQRMQVPQNPLTYAQPQARMPASVNNLLAVLNGAQAQSLQADVGAPGYPTGSPGRPYDG